MFSKHEGIADTTLLSRNMLDNYEFNTFINERNFDEVSNVVNFSINVRTKSMLSITSSNESCFIQNPLKCMTSTPFPEIKTLTS